MHCGIRTATNPRKSKLTVRLLRRVRALRVVRIASCHHHRVVHGPPAVVGAVPGQVGGGARRRGRRRRRVRRVPEAWLPRPLVPRVGGVGRPHQAAWEGSLHRLVCGGKGRFIAMRQKLVNHQLEQQSNSNIIINNNNNDNSISNNNNKMVMSRDRRRT